MRGNHRSIRFLIAVCILGVAGGAAQSPVEAEASAEPRLFCTTTRWEEFEGQYASFMTEFMACAGYPVPFRVRPGFVGEIGVCNAAPTLVSNGVDLACRWQGFANDPNNDVLSQVYYTNGLYVCLVTDVELYQGQYLLMLGCTERHAWLWALFGV
jgi:hypothetical protein